MGKFAGFLKRAKQVIRNVVHESALWIKSAYNNAMPIVRPIDAAAVDVIVPGLGTASSVATKPLQKLQDDLVNKGLDWITKKIEPAAVTSTSKPLLSNEMREMLKMRLDVEKIVL